MPTPEHEPTQAEPTIDAAPPDATSLATGPSQVAAPTAAGRGRRTWVRRAAIVVALVATFGVGIGVGRLALPIAGGAATAPNPSSVSDAELRLINEAWETLHREYVGKDQLDDRDLAYAAIDGLTEAVGDTGHTSFLTPEERRERQDSLSGSYVGIGVRIDAGEEAEPEPGPSGSAAPDPTATPAPVGPPRIVEVFEGSPAEKAGVKAGDLIIAVDGTSAEGKTLDEVATLVRGEAGTSVSITLRSADGTERTLEIIRADVPLHPVSWTMVPGTQTALIDLDQFSNGAADAMVEALKAARAEGAERVVLDLRGNPGGYVNEAVGVASQFLRQGLVYVERDASGHRTEHPVSPEGVATDLPVVVLVDDDTASSAEIVSGALQDAGRATVIGTKTFGTGTVLGEFGLEDGSALRIGTVEWLTPKGRRIWHEGIAPDVTVDRPAETLPLSVDEVRAMTPAAASNVADPQLARALSVVAQVAGPS